MNTLNSYEPDDQLNKDILAWLHARRPGGQREYLYLGDERGTGLTTNNRTPLSSMQYAYTTLETIDL